MMMTHRRTEMGPGHSAVVLHLEVVDCFAWSGDLGSVPLTRAEEYFSAQI